VIPGSQRNLFKDPGHFGGCASASGDRGVTVSSRLSKTHLPLLENLMAGRGGVQAGLQADGKEEKSKCEHTDEMQGLRPIASSSGRKNESGKKRRLEAVRRRACAHALHAQCMGMHCPLCIARAHVPCIALWYASCNAYPHACMHSLHV